MSEQKIPDEIKKNIEAVFLQSGFSAETQKSIFDVFNRFLNQDEVDDIVAQRFGQFFYYYAQIDDILTKIINSLLPELDISIMGLDSSVNGNSFLKKVELIRSLTPNANELKIFPLLQKLNAARNKLAHESPDKIDFDKMNSGLVNAFKDAFNLDDEIIEKISKAVNSNRKIDVPVKVIMVTKQFLYLFADVEVIGKQEEHSLKFFESIRALSSLYVRRRFSILAYQIQTLKKSGDAPESFRQKDKFDAAFNDLKISILSLFKKEDGQ